MKSLALSIVTLALGLAACGAPPPAAVSPVAPAAAPTAKVSYFDTTGRTDVLSGGARKIPIKTPKGTFNVWTKRVGNNPTLKVLLLHG